MRQAPQPAPFPTPFALRRFGSYGPTGGLQHGARVIELVLGEDPAASATWIWQQDGTRHVQTPAPQVQARAASPVPRCDLPDWLGSPRQHESCD